MIKDDLLNILKAKKWEQPRLLAEYVANLPDAEEKPDSTRTGSQNRGIHLWYRQISDLCVENGIDASMMFSKTHDIQMTPEAVKTMWKALQLALFGKKSTTELKKTGEIDKLQDHFIRFFAEKFELELPPFPSDEGKLSGYKSVAGEGAKGVEYTEMVDETKADMF
jgi:hypothetical protein